MTVGDSVTSSPADGADDGCVFCAIATGRAEASLVFADDTVLAFMDVAPVTPGHVLVIPREHARGLADLDEERGTQLWRVAHRVAKALRASGLRVEGVNLFLADGEVAFQQVFHVHLHVFPRYRGDGFRVHTDGRPRHRAELDADAAQVGRALAELTPV